MNNSVSRNVIRKQVEPTSFNISTSTARLRRKAQVTENEAGHVKIFQCGVSKKHGGMGLGHQIVDICSMQGRSGPAEDGQRVVARVRNAVKSGGCVFAV